jgi:hypothetical protein
MKYILEKSKLYNIGDIVLIEYWWNDMITPVIIKDLVGKKYLVSHNNKYSKIHNAPDEKIKSSDIIDKFKDLK